MAAALANARRRTLRLLLHALQALGHGRTLSLVRSMMTSPDERTRANAIESLASLPSTKSPRGWCDGSWVWLDVGQSTWSMDGPIHR